MKNFFRNNYGFICGVISGFGFAVFCIEASHPVKRPLFYIGGLGLSIIARLFYQKYKKDDGKHLDVKSLENNEAKAK
jgi:hypothetical protein